MKITLLTKIYISLLLVLACQGVILAQVGINTTAPQPGAMLDIESSTKGMLVPRVDIANLNTIAPITGGSTESLLVYNTNVTTGKGFYYWDGSFWVEVSGEDWKLTGNSGTDEDNDFVGTLDGQALSFRTNNIERFRVANGDQVLAMANGSAAAPFYSWNDDRTMGFWKSGTRQMDMVINGSAFFNANANTSGGSDLEWSFNPGGVDMNLRVETDNNANSLFVSGEHDNVGLGTNSPSPSSQLDMADINKGLLVNRVSLTATNNASPITSPANGLLVYNTANASSGSTVVAPGFYYWDGSNWIAMGGTGGKDWSLEGNAGTNASTNFIGTTDAVSLVVRTDDTERMYIDAAGTVGIGDTPYSNVGLRVHNASQDIGIIAETSGAGTAIQGIDSGTGNGVTAISANAWGLYGQSNASNAVSGGAVLIGAAQNNANGAWILAGQRPSDPSAQNIGVRAVSGSYTSVSPVGYPTVGMNANATDLGLYSMTEGPITSLGTLQSAYFTTNYTGPSNVADSQDPHASLAGYTTSSLAGAGPMFYGGYFYSGSTTPAYAYAGANYNGTTYKIIGNGTVSTIVDGLHENDPKKVMFAPEAPEVLFEDYGTGYLENGSAHIYIDPLFSKNIIVDQNHKLKVFIQLEGDCNGVYVTNKTAEGFLVKELQNGQSNVAFSWHIVANRKDDTGNNNLTGSKFADLRFPDAPSEMELKGAKNQLVQTDQNQSIQPKGME